MRKTICIIGFWIFSLFSYWQLNDTTQFHTHEIIRDLWVVSYASVALLSLTCSFTRLAPKIFFIAAAVPFLTSIFRAPYIDWNYDTVFYNPDNPAANETGGLICMALWLWVLAILNKPKARRHA